MLNNVFGNIHNDRQNFHLIVRVFSNQLDRHTSSQQDIRLSVRPSKRENAVVDPITY